MLPWGAWGPQVENVVILVEDVVIVFENVVILVENVVIVFENVVILFETCNAPRVHLDPKLRIEWPFAAPGPPIEKGSAPLGRLGATS